ncbi:BatD family protein [uncultured Thiohalocapsa sp.]|uniref:BatD family protein n=1 Tax=uncultured Thiohalocapsa sp. TaxID=768990 RepID=UPI0025D7A4BF|nr:BatD family protein [uncultured Thiohalocapsa sp.]
MRATVKQPWLMVVMAALLVCSGALRADVSARFDRSTVQEGDTVSLIVETDGLRGGQPDLSALDADFEVLGTSSGSRIQIVNGRQSAMRTWQVQLRPRRLGTIEVPPITVGSEHTSALRLTVTELPQGPSGVPGDDLFLEIDVGGDDEPVYVQQQVPLTVRLYSTLPLRTGELSQPRADGAVLERLGEDVQYRTTRNGRRYEVIERRFSLSPERSGELRIPAVSFEGELRGADGGPFAGDDRLAQMFRDPVFEHFGSGLFERGEPVRARSGAVTLDVQPQPEAFGGAWWLPAQDLALDDSWARDPPALARGEPVTRTLTVTAAGLAGSQIPAIEVPAPDAVRIYADNVEAETRTDGEQLFGVSRQQVTVMPTAGGDIEFPAIRLRWWDVQAGREREAVVPARRFQVAGPAGGGASAGARPAAPTASDNSSPAPVAAAGAGGDAVTESPAAGLPNRLTDTRRPVGWLLLAAMLAGMLFLGWRWRRHLPAPGRLWRGRTAGARRRGRGAWATAAVEGGGPGQAAALRAAAGAGDAPRAAQALLGLARVHWGADAPTSLDGVAARLAADDESTTGEAAATAVRALEARLYGPQAGAWDGGGLTEAVLPVLRGRRAADAAGAADEPLAPLYPRRC